MTSPPVRNACAALAGETPGADRETRTRSATGKLEGHELSNIARVFYLDRDDAENTFVDVRARAEPTEALELGARANHPVTDAAAEVTSVIPSAGHGRSGHASATTRNPRLPVVLSGEFPLRAATRYRRQYDR